MDKKNSNNPFRRENKQEKSKKEDEWGKVKFNPVARTAVTEQATPWSHFKNDLIKQQDQSNLGDNANSEEMLRKREENYRRNLIISKRNEPTQWEDFSDEIRPPSTQEKTKPKAKTRGTFDQIKSNIKNIKTIKKEDFDSKLLTKNQNNFLKKFITRNTVQQKGVSFEDAVEDMRLHGVVNRPAKREFKTKHKKKTKK